MPFPVNAEPVPLFTDADGVVRIGSSRVTLDTLIEAFQKKAAEVRRQNEARFSPTGVRDRLLARRSQG